MVSFSSSIQDSHSTYSGDQHNLYPTLVNRWLGGFYV